MFFGLAEQFSVLIVKATDETLRMLRMIVNNKGLNALYIKVTYMSVLF